jgi:anti-sigma factor (TIGR02949 family)
MKDCREVIDLLTEYLEGTLASQDTRALEAHLAGCSACAEFLESLRSVRTGVGTLRADAVPEECRKALRSFLSEAAPKRPGRR